jgi:hypothetical protein
VKPGEASVGLDERFLRQIIGQRVSATRQPAQESAHRRLVLADEFAEGVPVVVGQHTGDEFCIAMIHPMAFKLVRGFKAARQLRARA